MKKFIIFTAIVEGLTGIILISIPNSSVLFLLGKPTNGPEGKMMAMLAGAAILSLAVICWILRETPSLKKLVKGMLFYNCVIITIAMYGMFCYGITNPGMWFVILGHSTLFVWGGVTLFVKRSSNV
jgi:urea transporter